MATYIASVKELTKTLPSGKALFQNIYLSFFPGAKIGIVGLNGAGKSTFMKILSGLDPQFSGDVWVAPGTNLRYLPQEPVLDESLTVEENICQGLSSIKKLLEDFEGITQQFSNPDLDTPTMEALLEQQSALQMQIDALDGWDLDRRVHMARQALGCPDGKSSVVHLSGGEKRRVALCQILLSQPDLLLLDEPTNHLDAQSVAWLESYLKNYKGTVILITHDRYFLDEIVGWILEIDHGKGIPFEGNYSKWLSFKQKNTKDGGPQGRVPMMERELLWRHQSAQQRFEMKKKRISGYGKKREGSTSLENQIFIPQGHSLGSVVLKVQHVSKGYSNRILLKDLDFTMPPGAVVGVIGANGSGKTTFLRLLMNKEAPDKGVIRWGETVKLGYVDQERHHLDPQKTVWEEIAENHPNITLENHTIASRAYCSWFNFKGTDQQKKVKNLSGGEKNRVHLAKLLKTGSNVLLLDEPTNDLDLETLRALEEAILSFSGCAVVVSHDRWFLNRIATHILAFEGEGVVSWFEGDYESYARYKGNQKETMP